MDLITIVFGIIGILLMLYLLFALLMPEMFL